jgi:hypothetical protein
MALDVIVIKLLDDVLDHFYSTLERLLKAGGVEHQVTYVLPLGVDRNVFLDGGNCFGELAATDEQFTIELTFGPVFSEELWWVESVAVAGKHCGARPKTSHTIEFL